MCPLPIVCLWIIYLRWNIFSDARYAVNWGCNTLGSVLDLCKYRELFCGRTSHLILRPALRVLWNKLRLWQSIWMGSHGFGHQTSHSDVPFRNGQSSQRYTIPLDKSTNKHFEYSRPVKGVMETSVYRPQTTNRRRRSNCFALWQSLGCKPQLSFSQSAGKEFKLIWDAGYYDTLTTSFRYASYLNTSFTLMINFSDSRVSGDARNRSWVQVFGRSRRSLCRVCNPVSTIFAA